MAQRSCAVLAVMAFLVTPAGADDKAAKLNNAEASQRMAERALAVGEYERGLTFAETALAEREAVLPPDDPLIADSAYVVGVMRGKNGDLRIAEQLLRRVLAIREKALAKDSTGLAAARLALGELLREAGDFMRAEPFLVQALATEQTRGESPALAEALEALALLWAEKDDPRCESMFRRAVAIHEKTAGADDVAVARPVKSLADLLARRGDAKRAEPLYRRAMAILDNTGDLGDPRRASALLDFARVQLANGRPAEALKLGGFAYTIDLAILGAENPRVARDLLELGRMARAAGDSPRAERYTWRAVTIREKIFGSHHPDVGAALVELAASYAARGDRTNADKLLKRALEIFRRSLGPKHPTVAATLVGVAKLAMARNDAPAALTAMTEAGEIREASLELLLYAGSERQKRLYLATLADETDAAISLHAQFAATNPAAARLALLTLLRRKGRVLDTMSDSIGAFRGRASAADAAAFDKLAISRSRLASLVLRGPLAGKQAEHETAVRELEDESQKLEAEISARSPAFRAGRTRVTLEGVQAAMPAGRALVEIASYRPLPAGEPRYIAYILERTGEPRWVDLGPETTIDALVKQLREALADPKSDPLPPARELDTLAMAPIRALLGKTRELLLSPDGALNLVPFGALVDESSKFVVENYSITYLTTGRDLLRIAAHTAVTKGALVVAAPTFGPSGDTSGEDEEGETERHSLDLSQTYFPPLPGTVGEGTALQKLFAGGGAVVMGDTATEAQLKKTRAPLVLHIATHGFFLRDSDDTAPRSIVLAAEHNPTTTAAGENPLLRSGLALAGANRLESGTDDGVLTALEAAGLDLFGTQVVALSACETGLGEVHNGEGVYGLRRALVIAGSESQLISLWKVDDNATRDLMIGYYDSLITGGGRMESLRKTQLAMLTTPARRHPYYWAGFIQSGDWRPMRGTLAGEPAKVPRVARGGRGCGCDSSSPSSGAAGLAAIVLALAFARRRRRAVSAAVMTLALLVLAPRAEAAPATTQTLVASKLEIPVTATAGWKISDTVNGRQAWDIFARTTAPDLTLMVTTTRGPTSCLLTSNTRHLEMMKGSRLVTAPSYLPPEMYPEVIELSSPTATTIMACADLPDGTTTAIVRYKGTAWAKDVALATPLLRVYLRAAAWGTGGQRPPADRVVKLPVTELSLKLPPSWRERTAPDVDILQRLEPGKPAIGIGISTDVMQPPLTRVNGKLVQPKRTKKNAGDDCDFWADGIELTAKSDVELIKRPAFVPTSFHARASLILSPEGDMLELCQDTKLGRWIVNVQYPGPWSDPGLGDATAILKLIAASP